MSELPRIFKLATQEDEVKAQEVLNDAHKSIQFYYSLPPEQFSQLKPSLQNALNSLKDLYRYEGMARQSLALNLPRLPVETFARRYYRWLRGETVPEQVLNDFINVIPVHVIESLKLDRHKDKAQIYQTLLLVSGATT